MEKNKISFRDYVESYNRTVEKEIKTVSVIGYCMGGLFVVLGILLAPKNMFLLLLLLIEGLIFIGITYVIHRWKNRILGISWGALWVIAEVCSGFLLLQEGEFDLRAFVLLLCYGIAYMVIFYNAHKQYKRYLIATATTSNSPAYDKK